MQQQNHATRRSEFAAGFKNTLPLVIGAIPFGLIFGALAVSNGVSPAGTMGMSAFVFAGSAQFIASGLVAGGASVPVIILTTLVVNARHALYAATLSPYMSHLPQRWLFPLGFWLTDESFVIVAARYYHPDSSPFKHWYYLGSAIFMYANWQAMTYVGIHAGQHLDFARLGLDFAMSVTFIGLLIPLIRNRAVLATVVVAAGAALAVNALPNKLGLIAAAALGVIAGMVVERCFPVAKAQADARPTKDVAAGELLI